MTTDPEATRSILVIGATSALAQALCRALATPSTRFALAARDAVELEKCAKDIHVRHGCRVSCHHFEATDYARHPKWVQEWCDACDGAPDGVVVCHGYLPITDAVKTDGDEARLTLDINLVSVVSVLTPLAERMAARGSGWIVGISSVAGDRGRQSNYPYGAAKAGVTTYLQGLRNRLMPRGVHVLTVKPGPMDTPMLRSLERTPSRSAATPDRVARDIRRALRRELNVIYSPWYWGLIMRVIRLIPESVFKRMGL